jgi:cyclopropane fatty-acyl-phospholipid synthase-like methyltransferase
MSHLQSQASAKDAATNYRISELEKVNSSLQTTLDQQKASFEHDASKLVAEVERLNQQLIEAQVKLCPYSFSLITDDYFSRR